MRVEPSWREVADLITGMGESAEARLPDRLRSLRESYRDESGAPAPLSHTDLARRLAEVGWVTDRTTLWKIENPSARNGRRKVTIDELLALAKAFGVTVAELLLPGDAIRELDAWRAFSAATEALNAVRYYEEVYRGHIERVRDAGAANPRLIARIEEFLESSVHQRDEQLARVWINDADDESESRFRERVIGSSDGVLPVEVSEGYGLTPAIRAAQDALAPFAQPVGGV